MRTNTTPGGRNEDCCDQLRTCHRNDISTHYLSVDTQTHTYNSLVAPLKFLQDEEGTSRVFVWVQVLRSSQLSIVKYQHKQ